MRNVTTEYLKVDWQKLDVGTKDLLRLVARYPSTDNGANAFDHMALMAGLDKRSPADEQRAAPEWPTWFFVLGQLLAGYSPLKEIATWE